MELSNLLSWRPRSIPERFGTWWVGGFALAVLWSLASGSALVLVFGSVVSFEGAAAAMASDDAFATWKPETRAGRLLRAYIYRIYWTRWGTGRVWVRRAFCALGLALLTLVAFGLAWSIAG